MPSTTAKIDRDQRDGLYELTRNHLGSIGDLWHALEDEEDYVKAEALGLEFEEDFRLLRDIGWTREEYRSQFALTMPTQELRVMLLRLHGEAEVILTGSAAEREAKAKDAEVAERFRRGHRACKDLLAELSPAGGES